MNRLVLFLFRKFIIIQASLAIISTFLVGIYINLLTSILSDKDKNYTLYEAIISLTWWNILIFGCLVIIISQSFIANVPKRFIKTNLTDLINSILESACHTLVFPNSHKHIRAIITLIDKNTGQRVTKYSFNTEADPERIAAYPKFFGVTGEAYRTKSVKLLELPPDHISSYSPDTQEHVLPEIKTILAAPILRSQKLSDEPIGVLAFDSILTIDQLKWTKKEIKTIAQNWADIISKLLIYSGK